MEHQFSRILLDLSILKCVQGILEVGPTPGVIIIILRDCVYCFCL
jgi:hypothetical protein